MSLKKVQAASSFRAIRATTTGMAMAVPVIVSINKNVSCAPPLTKATLMKPDSHMHES